MSLRCSAVILLWVSSLALADVVTYEATVTPDQAGWEIIQLYCDPDVWIQEGWLFEDLQMCEGIPVIRTTFCSSVANSLMLFFLLYFCSSCL